MAISDDIKAFVGKELLHGADGDLTESTPLLELGLIDSMSIIRVVSFAHEQFGVEIPPAELTPANLASIQAIADLVARLQSNARR